MKICVIGAGTYGSYLIDTVQKKHPNAQITLLEVGNKKVKSEKEIGYYSSLKKSLYRGLTEGRYFGYGGASAKWGGQLLTFSKNDFSDPTGYLNEIVDRNMEYKKSVLAKFKIENNYPENNLKGNLFTKTGVWLGIRNRNFFKVFRINKRKNVEIISSCRVVRLNSLDKKKIDSVVYLENGIEKTATFDYYFLTSGAFENARILLESKLTDSDKIHFSDHVSKEMFKVKNSTKIGNEDFIFRIKGTSLITKRMVGEINDCSFYVHPRFNPSLPFFESLKILLFKRTFSWTAIKNMVKDTPNVIAFFWSILVKRKLYVVNNEWLLNIDIENPTKNSYVALSEEKDKFGLSGLDVYYDAGSDAEQIFEEARDIMVEYLDEKKVDYDLLNKKINIQSCEDIYHPYGMFNFKSLNEYYTQFDNMLLLSTGMLPRSGGINPTAVLLPLIDEFIENSFSQN